MSHAPTPRCWSCSKPMTGEMVADSRLDCESCGFHSCGECLLGHYRRAHPGEFMVSMMPAIREANLERATAAALGPRMLNPGNVIPLRRPT